MTLRLDPILDGAPYPLPGGRTIYHLLPLPEDATPEQCAYRRWALSRLDLYGQQYIVGSQADLALFASEERADDSTL